jgi:hypothetical protein
VFLNKILRCFDRLFGAGRCLLRDCSSNTLDALGD